MSLNTKLLFATILLIAFVHYAASTSHSHHSKRDHQDRNQRSLTDNHVKYPTSCGENLCTVLSTYPERKIYAAWKQFERLVQSDVSVFQRVLVASGYLAQQYNPSEDIYPSWTEIQYNCNTEKKIIYPVEGWSADDNEHYYIINVSLFSQSVQKKTCKFCLPRESFVHCMQKEEYDKLLVIPVKKNSFKAEDVTVKAFAVPNGCACNTN